MEAKKDKFLCPCCEKHYFDEIDDFEICPVCDWVNEIVQTKNPDFRGGANHMSLNQARAAYRRGEPVR